jgi:hypothetical protein
MGLGYVLFGCDHVFTVDFGNDNLISDVSYFQEIKLKGME